MREIMNNRRWQAVSAVAAVLLVLVAVVAWGRGSSGEGDQSASASSAADCTPSPSASPTEEPSQTPTEEPSESPSPSTSPSPSPSPTPTEPPDTDKKIIGMSAPSGVWSQRLSEVGPQGVKARRIFANLQSDGRGQSTLIGQAVNAGMMPVVSYKVPSVATLNSGGYDTWLANTRAYLVGLGVPVAATFWHEPHNDMTAADFRTGSAKFLVLKAPTVKVGPLLNGFLLDNQVSTFASYTSPALLAAWDWVGVDSYQNGTASSPGTKMPGRGVTLLETWLDGQGFGDKPIGLGEYNGFTEQSIASAGEALLSTPEVWFGLVWNSDTATFDPLSGSRLTAFKATKADLRALQ